MYQVTKQVNLNKSIVTQSKGLHQMPIHNLWSIHISKEHWIFSRFLQEFLPISLKILCSEWAHTD
jgi:hypothetical protein